MTNIKGKVPCCRRRQIAVEKASTMKILILNHTEVERLLPMAECIEVMAEALADLSAGRMHQPLRSIVRPPDAIGLLISYGPSRVPDASDIVAPATFG